MFPQPFSLRDFLSRGSAPGFVRRRLPQLASVLAITLLGYSMWELRGFWRESGQVGVPGLDSKPPAVLRTQKTGKAGTGAEVANLHLFGKVAPTESAADPEKEAPDTKLKLVLRGILASDEHTIALAIIRKPEGEERYFAIGEQVFGLASLEEIYTDRVILLRKGRYETLRLPEESLGIALSMPKPQRQARLMVDYRDAILSGDHEKFVGVVDIDTTWNDDGFYGFKILAESEKGIKLLSDLGLQPNDVVIELNGKAFAESLEAARNLGDLRTAKEISFVVDRDGTIIPFHFKLEP